MADGYNRNRVRNMGHFKPNMCKEANFGGFGTEPFAGKRDGQAGAAECRSLAAELREDLSQGHRRESSGIHVLDREPVPSRTHHRITGALEARQLSLNRER